MKKCKIGETVVVNKDIFRLEENYELELRNKGLALPTPKTLEEYEAVDWSLWRRHNKLYAKAGEEGVVVDIFHDKNGNFKQPVRRYAKVRIGDELKTFRITSLNGA